LKTKDALNTDRPDGTNRISLGRNYEYDQQGSSRYTEEVSQLSSEPDLNIQTLIYLSQLNKFILT